MPNWCSNTMTITAKDKESLEKILERIGSKESPIDFERIIPQEIFDPEYQFNGDHMNGDLDERNPRFDWYTWRVDHWGTKWNACEASVWRDGDSCARFEFDTAWSPATPVFRKLVEMFPDASIYGEYDEEGMGFHGEWGRDEGGSFYDDFYEGSPEE